VLTVQDVPLLQANLPTPWMGLKERVNIYAYMLWVAALAISLWPRSPRQRNARASSLLAYFVPAFALS
jgi:hypothetical protein